MIPEHNFEEANFKFDLDAEQSSIKILSEFFARESTAGKELQQIFSRYLLCDDCGSERLDLLCNSLDIYLGEDNEKLFIKLILLCLEDRNILNEIKKVDLCLANHIRLFASLYGNALENSYSEQIESPNSWSIVLPKVSREILSGQWLIHLLIEKNNGEEISLEESPLSVIQLAISLVSIVNEIPPHDAANSIPKEEIQDLEEVFEEFIRLFRSKVN